MHKIEKIITVGLIVFIVFFSGPVLATKLNVVTEHLPPYQIVGEDSITGLSTEIVEATLKEAKYEYDIKAYPWTLSFSRAIHRKNTCIYSLARIPQRESLFKWVGRLASSTISLYSLQNNQITINSLEEAKKHNIAVMRDNVAHHFLLAKGFVENKNLYVLNNDDALLKLLDMSNRNIELVCLNSDLLRNRIKSLDETSKYKRVFQFQELTLNFHLACSVNTEQKIVDNLINAMKMLEKRGDFVDIRNKWKKHGQFN
jgi:polar amino acid transport system substrate-binding protein